MLATTMAVLHSTLTHYPTPLPFYKGYIPTPKTTYYTYSEVVYDKKLDRLNNLEL